MNYAVIKSGGKQYVVRPNESFKTDKIEGNPGDKVSFDEVLLIVDGEKMTVGAPVIKGMSVLGKIVDQKSGDKVRVAKFKAKARYRKVRGFRAKITEVMVESIKEAKNKGEK